MKDGKKVPVYIPEKTFKEEFMKFAQESGYPKFTWNSDYWTGPFSNNQIILQKGVKKYYPRILEDAHHSTSKIHHGNILFGCDLVKYMNKKTQPPPQNPDLQKTPPQNLDLQKRV
jgi:hypothetical protein